VTDRCSPVSGEAKVHEAGQDVRPGGFRKQFDIAYEVERFCRIRTPEVSPKRLKRLSERCPRSSYYRCKCYEALPEVLGDSTDLTSGGSRMYGDDDSWPVKCPSCGHGFTDTIGRIKSRLVSSCPKCSIDFVHSRKQFLFQLSEAREGRHNPWWEIIASSKPIN
jgi:hypothetical protein